MPRPSAAAASVPQSTESSGDSPQTFAAWAAT